MMTHIAHRETSPGWTYIGRAFTGMSAEERQATIDASKATLLGDEPAKRRTLRLPRKRRLRPNY